MMYKRPLSLLLAAAIGPGAALAAPGITPSGTITIAMNADIRGTNPGVNRDANTDTIAMHMFEGLVAYTEHGAAAPMLAETVAVSPDGRTYTFTLRSGVRFHNGQPLTADDVVWSWKRYLNPATHWICLPDFDGTKGTRIDSVSAAGPRTVLFRLNRAQPMLLTQMAALNCGASAIIHKDSVNSDGSWKAPVGTGPYMLGEWRRGAFIELAAFKDYASRAEPRDGYTGAKIAYADKLRWLIIKDDAARRAALLKGQVDLLPSMAVAELDAMRKLSAVAVKSSPTMQVNTVLIQSHDPLLANQALREALAYSLDVRGLTEVATGGTGSANASMVPTASPYYSAVQKEAPGFDLAHARALLAKAGYRGQPIKLVTNRRYADMYDQAMMVQGMARRAGINIELEVLEWATQLDRYQSGNYQLMSFSYSARVDPFMTYDSILGDRRKSKRKVWDNPAAIALLEQAGNTAEPAVRQQAFDQLHRLMLKDLPLIVLFNMADVNAVGRTLDGFAAWPLSRERLWGVRRR